MESQFLNEQIEWQARRVAAAFDVQEWQKTEPNERRDISEDTPVFSGWNQDGTDIEWKLGGAPERAGVEVIWINSYLTLLWSDEKGGGWYFDDGSPSLDLLARGLYRLSIEVKDLPDPLTAHEKLELRRSMPREFWPTTWSEEDNTNA